MSAKQPRVAIKHETPTRELLDRARRAYGAEDWDDEDLQSHVLDLVTEAGQLADKMRSAALRDTSR